VEVKMQNEVAILKEKIDRLEEKILVLDEAEIATHDMLMFCRDMEIAALLFGAGFSKKMEDERQGD
jgi:hypothetical protein